jgi:uroporphyrinogen III methyltransferase / synthase
MEKDGKGIVCLVGAGPGDPGLITVKGLSRLADADVVVYDRLVHPELLEAAKPGAELIFIGKAYGRHVLDQDELNNLLVYLAASGKRVVRLKGGDPFVFGRGSEEAEVLGERGIPVEIVPGVTSAVAAPAYAGIPVTDRRFTSSVTFVTGHKDPSDPENTVDWASLAAANGTLVIFMGMNNIDAIAAALIESGRPATTSAAVIEWGTYERQRTMTCSLEDLGAEIVNAGISSPAIVVIGDVVQVRERLLPSLRSVPGSSHTSGVIR